MPRKGGAFTIKETLFAKYMAETGDAAYARWKADLSQPGASRALARPEVQENIKERELKNLEGLLPKAVATLSRIIDNGSERGQLMATKQVFELTIKLPGAAADEKESYAMTMAELQRERERLQRMLARNEAEDAQLIEDITPSTIVEDGGVFG